MTGTKKMVWMLMVLSSLSSFSSLSSLSEVRAEPEVKIGVMGQVWGDHDLQASSTWQLRRAELSVSAKRTKEDQVDIGMMFDPVSVPTNVIQDLFVRYYFSEVTSLKVGQFKIPFGNESLRSSGGLDFVERARVMTSLGLGDRRDIGAVVTAVWKPLQVSIGAFNGSGKNTPDTNSSKDTVARVEVPVLATKAVNLRFGTSGYLGLDNDRQSFLAGGMDVEWSMAGGLIARAEYARGRLGTSTGIRTSTEGEGWQIAVLEPPQDKTQLGVRLEEFVPDVGIRSLTYRALTVGITYFVTETTKIQFNGVRYGTNEIWKFDTNLIRFNFQANL